MSGEWIEGVTPTWTTCQHEVVIARGTYLRDQEPTGDHPECWKSFIGEQENAALEYWEGHYG